VKRLLLIGGGHSHVEVVRRFGIDPPADAEVTLVSPERHMSYSGMLPGYLAGHYGFNDVHIDLERLCRRARIRFVPAEAAGLDLASRTLRYRDGVTAGFDILSLDIGSTPDASAPGASSHAIMVKPVSRLLASWERIRAAARQSPQSIVIVGGGAGGVELALAIEYRLRKEGLRGTTLAVVTDSAILLPQHPPAAGRALAGCLARRAITLHCGSRVEALEAGVLRLQNGKRVAAGWIVWATSASASPWLCASGLSTDARGFILVDDTLRSTSHPFVFASGDCAQLAHHSLPRSGVYAVRQAPVLAWNLRSAVRGAPLGRYIPQRRSLALISTGGRHAVATWGPIVFSGRWVWRWKDRIDRRFMATYHAAANSD
jgi:selenide,water dikinase